jgi:hypothetical protein
MYMITQIILWCTMFYCTWKVETPYVAYTENIASCIDWPTNWAFMKVLRVDKKRGTYTAIVNQKWYDRYWTKCDLIK